MWPLLALFLLSCCPAEALIIGADTRTEVSAPQAAPFRDWADSVVLVSAILKPVDSSAPASGYYWAFGGRKYGDAFTVPQAPQMNHPALDPATPFAAQPIIPMSCSGALIAPDIVLTAGHCADVFFNVVKRAYVAFGWRLGEDGQPPEKFLADQVYRCSLIAQRNDLKEKDGIPLSGSDWALLRLDRPVPDHRPLSVDRRGVYKKGTKVAMIGYPYGLPEKVETGVIRKRLRTAFSTNLPAFIGDSGAPVFNQASGLIEGILVQRHGGDDFAPKGDAAVERVVPEPDAYTVVLKSSEFLPALSAAVQPR
jgi:hypothetical protein